MRIKKDFAPVTITIESENELKKLKEILGNFQSLREKENRFRIGKYHQTDLDYFVTYLKDALN